MQSTMAGTSLFGISRPVEATGAKALLASWRELVYKCIADLKSKYPRSNDSQLAARIRVNRTSYIRFTSEIQKPQLENYLKLVVGSGNGHLASDALRLYDEDLGKVFEGVFEQANCKINITTRDLEKFLDEKNLYIAYIMCLKNNGASLMEIEDVVGEVDAQIMLDELVSAGLIKIYNGNYVSSLGEELNVKFNRTQRIKNIEKLNSLYKPRRSDSHLNHAMVLTEGLNSDGLIETKKAMVKFQEELITIFDNPNFRGNTPVFVNSVFDTFTTELFEKLRTLNEGGQL